MKRFFFWSITLGTIAFGAVALFGEPRIPPQFAEPNPPDSTTEKKAPPAIAYPLPDAGAGQDTLPELDNSDNALLTSLMQIQRRLGEWMIPERLARNIVATVDNLPREEVSPKVRPVKPVPGAFLVSREDSLHMATGNQERYRKVVRTFEETDPEQLVALYIRFYPVFQKAYQELGYPGRYFNDRVVTVIDHLLSAPELDAKVELVQPKVLFEFADPERQNASAGHKVMIRMGVENARRVKAHLKKIRALLLDASERVRSP